jgi:transcriptional regulator with XRE-family HTH domain
MRRQEYLGSNKKKECHSLGELIKIARIGKGLLQRDIDDSIHKEGAASRYERDRCIPPIDILRTLAENLGIPSEEINRFVNYDIRKGIDFATAKSLGELIKIARIKQGLLQKDADALIGRGGVVSRYELDMNTPPPETLKVLAERLNIPMKEMNRFLDYDVGKVEIEYKKTKSLGQLIKLARMRRGLTQREVACIITKKGAIERYELNSRIPPPETLKILVETLSIPTQEVNRFLDYDVMKGIEPDYKNAKTLGEILRLGRMQKGFSQREVNELLGLHNTYSAYECDKFVPSPAVLKTLAENLNIPPHEINKFLDYDVTKGIELDYKNAKTLGDLLRLARIKKGLLQREVNDLISKSGVVGQYERNEYVPSPETLKKMTNVLEIPAEHINRFVSYGVRTENVIDYKTAKSLGHLLKTARMKKGLSQREVDGIIRRRSAISFYELNLRMPPPKILKTLVKELNIPPQEVNRFLDYDVMKGIKLDYTNAKTLGELLKIARINKCMLQREVDGIIRKQNSISCYELNLQRPTSDTLKILVETLSIPPQEVNRFLDYDIREYLTITSKEIKDFTDKTGIKISDLELIVKFFEWGDPSKAISELTPESYSDTARIVVSKIITGQNSDRKNMEYLGQKSCKRLSKDPTKRTAFISSLLQQYNYNTDSAIAEQLKRRALDEYQQSFAKNKEKTLQVLEDKIAQLNGKEPLLKQTLQYVYSTLKEQSQIIPLNNAARYVTAVKVAE